MTSDNNPAAEETLQTPYYCSMPAEPVREFAPNVSDERAEAILVSSKKWVNGTKLRYYFFDPATYGAASAAVSAKVQTWSGSDAQRQVVRNAFKAWKDLGIGLEFEETNNRMAAEVRIGFLRGDGSWSYIGRDILNQGRDSRTMNLGWDLAANAYGMTTALHEIGHTLGMPHEHQNPFAGIVWNEEEVYRRLALPPNNWDRDTTFHNIIRKIAPNEVTGSQWDPDSVMHYQFERGMILQPAQYTNGIFPPGTLSPKDKEYIRTFYPALEDASYKKLTPHQSVQLNLTAGMQADFIFEPTESRYYEMRTFGQSDTVMVLFEDVNGENVYLSGDDDSGEDYNAYIRYRLLAGKKYIVRLRLYYAHAVGACSIMLW